jgi:regulator of cell morphogenesis and NO signaling
VKTSFKQTVDEIVARHHSFLRKELPQITHLMDKLLVESNDSELLIEAQQIYKKVRSKIETHLKDEELVLFPTGIALESGGEVPDSDMDLRARLAEMEKEHDGCGNALGTIAQMIGKTAPNELRDNLLNALENVQKDLRVHVDKENNQVHPQFLQLLNKTAL